MLKQGDAWICREGKIVYDRHCEIPKKITGPQHMVVHLSKYLIPSTVERFMVVLLNGRHEPFRFEIVSQGTLTASLVHPREVFSLAVAEKAASLIVAHNHPSGRPWPSDEDKVVTERLVKCGRLMGIALIDHIILGDQPSDGHHSMNEHTPAMFEVAA